MRNAQALEPLVDGHLVIWRLRRIFD